MPTQQLGRLAMRVEGDWWVAYFTDAESMKRAKEIGRLRMSLAADPVLKQGFMDFCRQAMSVAIKNATGQTPSWKGAVRAPEHERSGRG